MQDYGTAFTNFSGSYPDTLAVNASGPSATDGTEFTANMINDSMWGVWQMILNRAGLTPNGVVESDANSQIREALQKGFGGAPGTVQQWHLADDPGTSGHRCLLLNGQGILRANYPDLDAACYVGDGNNAAVAAAGGAYFRADNSDGSSPNIAGIYLILPETRGYVPRGLDTAASVDPDGASRYLGDPQLDAMQGHIHYSGAGITDGGIIVYGEDLSDLPGLATKHLQAGSGAATRQPITSSPKTDGVNGTPRISSETRMVNYSTKWVVWY
jgi:hypothetical protein